MKIVSLLVALAATLFLVACGAEEDPSKPASAQTQEAKNRKAMLDLARCMRENGVDMPDPQFNGGRVTQRMKGGNPDKMRAAEKACEKYRSQIKAPEMSDEEKAEFKQAALANARCMREHGIDNFPDPVFDSSGGAQIRMKRGINPESAKFQAAQKACQKYMKGPSLSSAGEAEK
jgi:hypothetical protein